MSMHVVESEPTKQTPAVRHNFFFSVFRAILFSRGSTQKEE